MKPPRCHLFSPSNGEFVPKGQQVDVVLKAYDRFGINSVELCQDSTNSIDPFGDSSACKTLSNINHYSFVVDDTASTPIVLHARATDLNNLVSQTQSLTLQPYDAEQLVPELAIDSPANGETFHDREEVIFAVRMTNVESALLRLVSATGESLGQQTISKGDNDSDLVYSSVKMPDMTAGNSVIIVRVETTVDTVLIRDERLYNLIDDNDIDEDIVLETSPVNSVLSGTQLHVKASVDETMLDFSLDSNVVTVDGTVTTTSAYDGSWHKVSINSEASSPTVTANLSDKSANVKTLALPSIAKLAYFEQAPEVFYDSTSIENNLVAFVSVPGFDQGVIWGENLPGSGFVIKSQNATVAVEATGKLVKMLFTGTGLALQINDDGVYRLKFYPMEQGEFTAAIEQVVLGDLIGGTGATLYMQYGRVISPLITTTSGFIPGKGYIANNDILNVSVDRQRLALLTTENIELVTLSEEGIPTLVSLDTVAIKQDGVGLMGDKLVSWQGNVVNVRVQNGGGWQVESTVELNGTVSQWRNDGELDWFYIETESQGYLWQAILNNEVVANTALIQSEAKWLAGKAVWINIRDAGDQLMQQVISPANLASAPDIKVYYLPNTVLLAGKLGEENIGLADVVFRSNDKILSATPIWYQGQYEAMVGSLDIGPAWLIANEQIENSNLVVERVDHVGSLNQILTIDVIDDAPIIATMSPANGLGLSAGAIVPVSAELTDASSVITSHMEVNGKTTGSSLFGANKQFSWLRVASETLATENISFSSTSALNYHQQSHLSAANTSNVASVLVDRISNNQILAESDAIDVAYEVINVLPNNTFKYAEVSLHEHNGVEVDRVVLANASGEITLMAPGVKTQENYFLIVRAYFNDSYQYAETKLSLRIAPEYIVQKPIIKGLPAEVLVGSDLSLRVDNELTGLEVVNIRVTDGINTLFNGSDSLQFTVPDTLTHISVIATIEDGFGNEAQTIEERKVIHSLVLDLDSSSLTFDTFLPGLGNYWYSRGNVLFDSQGELKHFDGDVTGIGFLSDALLVAVDGEGLVLLEMTDGYSVIAQVATSSSVKRIETIGDSVAIITADAVSLYDRSTNGLIFNRDLLVGEKSIDVIAQGRQFILLTESGIKSYDIDGVGSVITYTSDSFSAITSLSGHLYANHIDGSIWRFSGRDVDNISQIDVRADRMIALNGGIIALDAKNSLLQLVDVKNIRRAQVAATYAMAIGESAYQAQWYSGKLYMGGQSSDVINFNVPPSAQTTTLFESGTLRGQIQDIEIDNGVILIAAGSYGAYIYEKSESGVWQSSIYQSKAYQYKIDAISANEDTFYFANAENNQVYSEDRKSRFNTSAINVATHQLVQTRDYVVAAELNTLHILNIEHRADKHNFTLGYAEVITDLHAVGNLVFVATDKNNVYRVDLGGELDAVEFELITQFGSDIIESVSGTADHLVISSAEQLVVLDIAKQSSNEIVISADQTISAIGFYDGLLWIGYQSSGQSYVQAVDIKTLAPVLSEPILVQGKVVDLSLQHADLVIATDSSFVVVKVAEDVLSASSTIYSPLEHNVYQQGDAIVVDFEDSPRLQTVVLTVDGAQVAISQDDQKVLHAVLPSTLRSGQEFELNVLGQDIMGRQITAEARKYRVQNTAGNVNPFSVSLNVLLQSWLPNPLTIGAEIQDSLYGIDRVEFYRATHAGAVYHLLAQDSSSEYTIKRNFDALLSGQYLKARAVDSYGNIAESEPVQFFRLVDEVAPNVELSFTGATDNGVVVDAVVNQPFTFHIASEDSESGVESVFIYRDDILINAHFGGDEFSHTEHITALDGHNYRIVATDYAKQQTVLSRQVVLSEDAAPAIVSVVIPGSVREQATFPVTIVANDDAGIDRVEVHWHGSVTVLDGGELMSFTKDINLTDTRSSRVASSVSDELVVKVFDASENMDLMSLNF